jgi:hypothetical protein
VAVVASDLHSQYPVPRTWLLFDDVTASTGSHGHELAAADSAGSTAIPPATKAKDAAVASPFLMFLISILLAILTG